MTNGAICVVGAEIDKSKSEMNTAVGWRLLAQVLKDLPGATEIADGYQGKCMIDWV